MHRVAIGKFGIPQASRHAFDLLAQKSIINDSCALAMKHMVGFRNIAVHDYQKMQQPILQSIIQKHLSDFEGFLTELSL